MRDPSADPTQGKLVTTAMYASSQTEGPRHPRKLGYGPRKRGGFVARAAAPVLVQSSPNVLAMNAVDSVI
ncbi:hypothetical protein MLD38_001104 [Melastoma candidum]|uniref:Uncharacterized protein n=1 Tax=Melastoma candidum TaxID=119954 RepID=A0ACB9SKS2_9MYRT|nr:hypothetical protein MLD38_001104 [Melastoma candidum]